MDPSLPPESQNTINRCAEQFRQQWLENASPQIGDFLDKSPQNLRRELFECLLAVELKLRGLSGDRPKIDEYLQQFAEYTDQITEAFFDFNLLDTLNVGSISGFPGDSAGVTGRGLLLCVFAAQLDLLSQDEIISLAEEFRFEGDQGVSECLVAKGLLTAATCEMLEALVEQHLAKHDGNLSDSVRKSRIVELIERRLSGGESTDEASEPTTHDASSRYEIIQMHAQGGIGTVYLAEDQELSRTVALKALQPGQALNPQVRSRFVSEAEITGQLEHPGIVPIYGLGAYRDGRPFYAMRFVHGRTLQSAIAEYHDMRSALPEGDRRRELHTLLSHFVDVCNAVHYAHSRGVLHRDIKPANIMLGEYGETLVVDWGLARSEQNGQAPSGTGEHPHVRVSDSTHPTHTGTIFGTPAYMSPEQAAGQTDQINHRCDIYSLGATFYELLTGMPPYRGRDLESVLTQVRNGRFDPPIQAMTDVPRALNAVCLKAMQMKSEMRYESARQFADDVQNWIADEPVTAWQEPWIERTKRFLRVHQSAVISSAIAAVILLAGLTVGLVLVTHAKQRESEARTAADASYQRAEMHFQETVSAVDEFYTQVSEEVLLHSPGMQPVRRQLLQRALEFYELFLIRRGDDIEMRAQVAQAWFRIGSITEELSGPQEAISGYGQALDRFTELRREFEDSQLFLERASDTLNALGRCYHRLGDVNRAGEHYRQGLQLRQDLVRRSPKQNEYRRKLASSTMNIALASRTSGDNEEAYTLIMDAQQIRSDLLREDASRNRVRRDFGMGAYNLGVFRLQDLDSAAGEDHLLDAADAFEDVLQAVPQDGKIQLRLAETYRLLADHYTATLRSTEATQYYDLAADVIDLLRIRNPEVPEYAASLASIYMNQSNVVRGSDPQLAVGLLHDATLLLQPIVAGQAALPRYRHDLAVALYSLALEDQQAGDRDQAIDRAQRAAELAKQLQSEFPEHSDYSDLSESINRLLQSLNAI